MIYGKLPVTLLSAIASEKNGSTNCIIATYILENLDKVKNMGIKELALEAHVAMSSVSRFCKEIGLDDFNELKKLVSSPDLRFQQLASSLSFKERLYVYQKAVKESLDLIEISMDENQIKKLCRDIASYHQVAAFGLLKAQCAPISLQGDLLMQGKLIYTNVSYSQQIQYIEEANENDLILIFSYTGSYFDCPQMRTLKQNNKKPKIWMICGQQKEYPSFIDEFLFFESLHHQAGHPYQLQNIATLIAQEYSIYQTREKKNKV